MSHLFEPLPQSVRDRLRGNGNTHPGLELDKYAQSWSDSLAPSKLSKAVQQPTVDKVVKLSGKAPDGLNYDGLVKRRLEQVAAIGNGPTRLVKATTTGPLTLHLARASALENAGICLHPIYGFAFLPGTGIKGMARAWAETVWLPAQPDPKKAWQQLEDVFGWSPNRDRREQIDDDKHPCEPRMIIVHEIEGDEEESDSKKPKQREIKQSTGAVMFHDAWADEWPKLKSDILNSHHSNYYGGTDKKTGDINPPGDWENPIPVYFLTVGSDTPFTFALSHRTRLDGLNPEKAWLLDLAEQFVIGALRYNGAGAKTAAGYGAFRIVESTQLDSLGTTWNSAKSSGSRSDGSCTVKLATPGFLGGPNQYDPSDCELRESTLRGQLRWWWRTMHASWLSVDDLRRLEAAVWGNTDVGGAVRVTITPSKKNVAGGIPFDRRDVIYKSRLPKPGNKKTAQGLTYFSYGTDESNGRRAYKPVGSEWQVEFVVRPAHLPGGDDLKLLEKTNTNELLQQSRAALWLLTQYGGVGAKGRKGFGSLTSADELGVTSIEECRAAAAGFRRAAKLTEKRHQAESPSLDDDIIGPIEITTPWKDVWFAIDRIADAAQEFAQDNKHNLEKQALGLPRRVRQPFSGNFKIGKRLNPKDPRHSAPLIYHFDTDAKGNYVVRMMGFPSTELPADPTAQTSRAYLRNAASEIEGYIEKRAKGKDAEGGQKAAASPLSSTTSQATTATNKKERGDRVDAKLSDRREKRGKVTWKATCDEVGMTGAVQPPAPTDVSVGDKVELFVARHSPSEIQFLWITPETEALMEKEKAKKTAKNSNKKKKR